MLSQVWCEFGAPINWSEVDHQRCQNLYYFLTSKINFGPCQKAGLDDHIINNNIIECLLMLFIKTLLTFNKSNLTFKQRIIRIIKTRKNFSEAAKECQLLHWIPRKFRDPLICKFLPPPLISEPRATMFALRFSASPRRGSYTLSLAVVIKPHHLTSR